MNNTYISEVLFVVVLGLAAYWAAGNPEAAWVILWKGTLWGMLVIALIFLVSAINAHLPQKWKAKYE